MNNERVMHEQQTVNAQEKDTYNYMLNVIVIIIYHDDWSIIEFMHEYYNY